MKLILIKLSFILFYTVPIYCQEPDIWFNFINDDCSFCIDFPSKPDSNPQITVTDYGKMRMNIYQLDCSNYENYNNLLYMVNCTEFPDSVINKIQNLDDFYKNSITGMINNVHGKLIQETIFDYKNNQGRAIRVDFRDGLAVITARIILIGNKYYMMMIITDTNKDFNKNINRFFNSFKIISTVANTGYSSLPAKCSCFCLFNYISFVYPDKLAP